jgi:hypothetical protein
LKAVTVEGDGFFDSMGTGAMRVTEQLLITPGAFERGFPQIQIPADVNMELLTEGDANPMFITLPIMRVGATSRNKSKTSSGKMRHRVYGREAAEALVRSVSENRPTGIAGHPELGQRSREAAAIRWLGARLEGETVWAKFYVLPHRQDLREMLRTAMAANSKVATSLMGSIKGIRENGEVIDLNPTHIDLVDASEAGIPQLGSVPIATSESLEEDNVEIQELMNGFNTTVAELANVRRDLSERDSTISELNQQVQELRVVQETVSSLSELLGTDDVVAGVREMHTELTTLRGVANGAAIAEAVTAALGEVANNEAGASLIREMVGDVADATAATARVQELLGMGHIQAALKAMAVSESGPAAIVGGQSGGQTTNILEQAVENAGATAQSFGLMGS